MFAAYLMVLSSVSECPHPAPTRLVTPYITMFSMLRPIARSAKALTRKTRVADLKIAYPIERSVIRETVYQYLTNDNQTATHFGNKIDGFIVRSGLKYRTKRARQFFSGSMKIVTLLTAAGTFPENNRRSCGGICVARS